MYAVKHLCGDAILETSLLNDAYTEEQLAQALTTGKANLFGALLRVA